MQALERRRHLRRLHQHVGPVQYQEIEILDPQALEAAARRGQNVVVARVVVGPCARGVRGRAHHPALGLDDDAGAQPRINLPDGGECLLGPAVGIDVGQIEVIDARLQRRFERAERLAPPVGGQLAAFPRSGERRAAIGQPGSPVGRRGPTEPVSSLLPLLHQCWHRGQ